MKMQQQPMKQPGQAEIQPLLHLYNTGQLAQAEAAARQLLSRYPQALVIHNVLGVALEGQQKFEQAAASYRQALAIDPKIAEIHFNLGVVLANLGKTEEAIASYRKAVSYKANFAAAYFNLGIALQGLKRADEALAAYRRAIACEPGFFEAYGNLGAILQQQGKLDDAVANYRKAIAIQADAKGYFNLGTALRDQGKLDEAIASYRTALRMQPAYAEAHNYLGEALRDQGDMQAAVNSYQDALSVQPDYAEANYNLAQFFYDAGQFAQAIRYFEKSQLDDWQERTLYCLYKSQQYERFRSGLQNLVSVRNNSPFLATLSTHYATNFGVEDPYNFCPNPMDFVYRGNIAELSAPGSELLQALLHDIEQAEIAERKQGRLHYGIQSAGNLFKRKEASFRRLAELVRQQIGAYRQRFAEAGCEYMRSFPVETEFSSSWFVKMQQGGHLTSHIHETGWLSGSVYLALPQDKAGQHDGSIEFSTHGDNYPQQHNNFPTQAIAPKIGDIVLFPSSLFHRTIPFSSNEQRICVAFDLKP